MQYVSMMLLRTFVGISRSGERRASDSLFADRGDGESEVERGKKRGARPPGAVPTLNATAAVTSAVVANTTFMADDPPSGDPYIVVPSGRRRHPERLFSQPIPLSTRLPRPALGP